MFSGLSVESKGEGIVVSAVEEGRLAHVQGMQATSVKNLENQSLKSNQALQRLTLAVT